jgi:predicted  nucleic acid-binding Zn-ribbon protein
MSQTFKLFRLQQIDSQIDQAHARSREIEMILNDNAALRAATEVAQTKEAELSNARKTMRRSEDDVKNQRLKIEMTEATLYGGKVRNPKELQDLQHESTSLKKYLAILEDRQLEAMIALEDAEQSYGLASAELSALQEQIREKNDGLVKEMTAMQHSLANLESERQAATSGIEPDDISFYERLRQQRRGVAVAKVINKTCAACGTTLNAALLQATRLPNQLVRCDSCGRILYGGA